MHNGHPLCDQSQAPLVIRALHSLTAQTAETIGRTIADLDRGWSVQTWDDYDGYLSILIEPVDQDAAQPSYLISGTVKRIELAKLEGDEMTTLGAFTAHTVADQLVRVLQTQG